MSDHEDRRFLFDALKVIATLSLSSLLVVLVLYQISDGAKFANWVSVPVATLLGSLFLAIVGIVATVPRPRTRILVVQFLFLIVSALMLLLALFLCLAAAETNQFRGGGIL